MAVVLLATGRRTATAWLRAAGSGAEFRAAYQGCARCASAALGSPAGHLGCVFRHREPIRRTQTRPRDEDRTSVSNGPETAARPTRPEKRAEKYYQDSLKALLNIFSGHSLSVDGLRGQLRVGPADRGPWRDDQGGFTDRLAQGPGTIRRNLRAECAVVAERSEPVDREQLDVSFSQSDRHTGSLRRVVTPSAAAVRQTSARR